MKLFQYFKPNLTRVIVFIIIAIYFSAVKSVGFYQENNAQNNLKSTGMITVIGYPYAYFKTSKTGTSSFSIRKVSKNLVFYYLLTCILLAFLNFTQHIFLNTTKQSKIFYSSILINSVIGVAVLLKVFGGDLLTDAALKSNKKSMELLLSLGVDPNSLTSNGKLTPLMVAAKKNNSLMAQLLLEPKNAADADLRNLTGSTPLHEAVKSNSIAVVKVLLASGADVNSRDFSKSLPIHYVKKYEMAQLLVSNKANLTFRNKKGFPPIFFAPDEKTLNLFKRNGARLNVSIQDGSTLLDITKNPSIIRYLINNGAPINSRNSEGDTPLHKLMKYQSKKNRKARSLIKTLVKRGANVDLRDKHGFSALHYAIKKCDIKTGRLFINSSREAKKQMRKKLRGKLKQMAIRNPACWDKIQLGYVKPKLINIPKPSSEKLKTPTIHKKPPIKTLSPKPMGQTSAPKSNSKTLKTVQKNSDKKSKPKSNSLKSAG